MLTLIIQWWMKGFSKNRGIDMKNLNALLIEPSKQLCTALKDVIDKDNSLQLLDSWSDLDKRDLESMIQDINSLEPSVLLLGINSKDSVEMELFDALRREIPDLPIIVLTDYSREGAKIAIEAVKKGAVEYIIKTKRETSVFETSDYFSGRLLAVIKAVPRLNLNILVSGMDVDNMVKELQHISIAKNKIKDYRYSHNAVELLVIAGCLGGVPSLYVLIATLPEDLPIPVVIVQHMPDIYTEVLAEDLTRVSGLQVIEATDGIELQNGKVYLSPGDYHAQVITGLTHKFIILNQRQKVKGFRPSIDVMLDSVKKAVGKKSLVVYLSGGGQDGIEGAEVIDMIGGQLIIQNRRTSLLWDLPMKVSGLGLRGYPLKRMGNEISRRVVGVS